MKLRILFAVLLLCVACEGRDSSRPLRVALPGQPANIDNNRAYDFIAGTILMQMSEGLTRHDHDLTPRPALASNWEFSDDFRTITYTIREDARWSDGEPILARHFVDSWRRLLDPKTAAEYAYFVYDIVNAEAVNNGDLQPEKLGVAAPDDHTLVIRLRRPAPFFPHITTFMVTHPIRKDVIDRHGDAWTHPDNIVVSGAYKPVELKHEYRMSFVPNEHWVLGKPSIENLEIYMTAEKATAMNLFVGGDLDIVVDMLPIAIPAFRGKPAYVNEPKLEVRYVGIRVDKPPFDDVRVRRALALSIKREELPRVLKGGERPTKTWLPEGLFGHDPRIGYDYDPEKARAELEASGWDGSGEPLLLFRAGDDWRLIAENLQEQWRRELGIDVRIETREQKVFFREIDGEAPPPAHLARWVADFPDPENFMSLFKSNSGNNSLGFASKRYDELVEAAVRTDDEATRRAHYAEAQRILVEEEVAMIPIYVAAQNLLVNPKLEGLKFNAMGDFRVAEARWSDE